ncbi:hypothetical protein MJO28_015693 [Puccinia striiformis f. sp. tritici]|uniref:Uncharacterized protein n=1 Tax=Puccinia striiformis f. sp. tritici TaxID=168172 RepID=A0ACC0DR42_9BASI|nr:hypothetical protein MJO28_015693 [Puccinia striiformis f. sp. tritici]
MRVLPGRHTGKILTIKDCTISHNIGAQYCTIVPAKSILDFLNPKNAPKIVRSFLPNRFLLPENCSALLFSQPARYCTIAPAKSILDFLNPNSAP